jgi:tetratricopeptide (TPR) repeat protein
MTPRGAPDLAICAALCLLIVASFHPVAHFDFVDFDDPDYVVENPIVNDGLSAEGLARAFTESQSNNWHPLTWIAHMLDVSAFGMDPGAHHAVNLAIHALDTALLFLVLSAMTGARWRSAAVAALFAVHPAHVESVAWISQRKDTLSTLFWILCMGAWLGYTRRPQLGRYLLVALALAAGLMAKPMLVTLPLVLLLLDFWPLGRWGSERLLDPALPRLLLEKVPLLALAAAASVVTLLVQRASGALKSAELVPVGERVANALISYVRYLGLLVWPADLSAFHPRLPAETLEGAAPLAAAALLVALTTGALLVARTLPYLTIGWLWFVGTLVPVIGLVQVGDQSMAERYTYVAFIGPLVGIVWGVAALTQRSVLATRAAVAALVVVLVGCTAASYRQVGTWRDSLSLWTHALEVGGESATAHFHLAGAHAAAGQVEEELAHYRAAAELMPGAAIVRHNLGTRLAVLDRLDEAQEQLLLALRANPELVESRLMLADVLSRSERFGPAVAAFATALDAKPELFEMPAVQRGYVVALLGDAAAHHPDLDRAVASHRRALARRPQWHTVANNLAWILATDPRAETRHGILAIEVAGRSSRTLGGKVPALLDTLAAAQARAERFDEAAASADRGAEVAEAAGQGELAREMRARAALYRKGQFYTAE